MEEFDDEFGDLSKYKILSFDEISTIFKENKKLSQAIPNSSFEEISFEKKFGIENKCNEEKLGMFYHGQMRIDELISDLHKNNNNGKFFFNFGNYAVNYGFGLNKENPAMIKKLMQASYNDISRSTPYQYYQNQHRKDAKADIYLNMMACHVDVLQPGYIFYLDLILQTIEFRIQYVYSNYINFRNFNNTTLNKRDYELNNKYNAIIVKAKNALDFVMLAKPNDENYLKEKIVNLFAQETLKAASQKEIKFLYENMPDFVTSKLLEKLGANNKNTSKQEHEDLVWNHLEILSKGMENQDLFSWNIDFSGAMLNLLKVFGNSKFLFKKFKSNQTFVKKIFENLEGESVINGEKSSNKIAFASFVSTLCLHNGMAGLRKIDKGFSFGRYNGVNSADNLPREEKGNEFFLQKEKEAPIIDFLPMESFNEIIPDDDTGAYYHPMDMVLLVDADSKEKYPDIAAAILIKAIADAHEEQEREKIKRIGFDILGIVLGAVALATSGNPVIIAAAVSDVVVNTADTIVQGFDKDIVSLTGGAEFLQDWNTVYYSANLASAAIALPELFASGMKLIQLARTTGKTKAINFIKACIVKIILEKNIITFTGNTLKEGKAYVRVLDTAEAIKATAFFFNDTNLIRLYEKGVVIVEVTENGKKEFAFIYKNEVILQGVATDKNYKHIIYTLSRDLYHPFKMIERLEELRVAAFCKRMPKITNKFPTEELPEDGFLKSFEVKNGQIILDNNLKTINKIDFVVTTDGKLLLGNKHHFLGKRLSVIAAGNLRISNGFIKNLSNGSGHYFPTIKETENFPKIFKVLGLDLEKAWLETLYLDGERLIIKRSKIK